ncbi:DUF4870 domain-containing protein [Spelaeicoccus albus]|uniref:Tic20 family protein n=1 Tax=Spelaeicoccus albus TaxID=1280376 RepID=A0A7Z0IIN7_9MICO|nr:DUF4870 domain-containing protein [Spelaeicoccus albus]NYI68690.1 hypothetical protein [Spelaeicoccus albus]
MSDQNPPEPGNQQQPQQPGTPEQPGNQQGPPPEYRQAPPPGYQPPPPGYLPAPVTADDERTWATLAHAGGIILGWIAPLIIWLVYKERSQFITGNTKEALNFQLTVLIGTIISALLTFVFIGAILWPLVWIANIVYCILGAVASNRGEAYRYPITIRMIS